MLKIKIMVRINPGILYSEYYSIMSIEYIQILRNI